MDKFQIGHSVAFNIDYAAEMQCVVEDSKSIISIAMTGNGELVLSEDSKPVVGDEIILKVSSDATARDLSFGAGFTAPTLTGTINKTKTVTLVYDGTSFIAKGASVQID